MPTAPDLPASDAADLRPRIVLVTTFDPTIGGGGAILRHLLAHLTEVRVRWLYVAPRDLSLPDSLWLGPSLHEPRLWRDIVGSVKAWILQDHRGLQRYAERICAEPADGFWIVGHNEGLLLALLIAQKKRPVHLTIHDDVPDGLFGRSRRYRWLRGAARRVFVKAYSVVRSLDVVSHGMQAYYRERYGMESGVILPYLPPEKLVADGLFPRADETELVCGHIGLIYHLDEFVAFCAAFVKTAERLGRRPRLLLIGSYARSLDALSAFSACIESHPALPEPEAVRRLAACDFVYAMYPFDTQSTVFRRTSLPTKVSTYTQALRPIFAHTPADSTLAQTVERFAVGKACGTCDEAGMTETLEALLREKWERRAFEELQEAYYGWHNVRRMNEFLQKLGG